MSRESFIQTLRTGTRVRYAYLRLQALVDRQRDRASRERMSHWEVIDRHLEAMRAKSHDFQVAYAKLILSYDAELFDGINTGQDILALDVSLPSDEEVQQAIIRETAANQPVPNDMPFSLTY